VLNRKFRASKSPTFHILNVASNSPYSKPLTSQANGRAEKLKELIKDKIIVNY